MTNTIFTSKEQYLSFRAAWAKSVNTAQPNRNKMPYDGCVAPEQHMLYNILRGKHPECGFTRITNHNKLNNGTWCNHASFYANMRLRSFIDTAKEPKKEGSWLHERMERFLSVFEGTITVEMLASLKIDKINPISNISKQEAA